ncbi:hypothetical protein BHM03_00031223 [Ensete ventricosum]|nr:hypothetical protein BHM03_00031223 [Ensete ventricosum]
MQITTMDFTNSEQLHTKDNGMRTGVLGFTHSLELRRQMLLDFAHLLEVVLYASSWLLAFCLLFAHTFEALEVFILLALSITYCILCSLVEHSCINPKSLTFGYLDEKPVDTGLMKFLGLCPSALSWYLEFASAFSTSSTSFTTNASLHESKGLMTPWKSHLCSTMALPAHGPTICCLAYASAHCWTLKGAVETVLAKSHNLPSVYAGAEQDVTRRRHGVADSGGIVHDNTIHADMSCEGHDHAEVCSGATGSSTLMYDTTRRRAMDSRSECRSTAEVGLRVYIRACIG